MSARAATWRTRADFRQAPGVLLVLRDPPAPPAPSPGQPPIVAGDPAEGLEVLLAVCDDGQAIALLGHVDLGTGIRTAYGQIAAEELDLPLDCVVVILGDTARAPNQGPTIASTSLQIHAQPLRLAAAQARAWLVDAARARWGSAGESAGDAGAAGDSGLSTQAGEVVHPDGRRLAYAELLTGQHVELMLDAATPTKPEADYTVVGTSAPRLDLPAKATGGPVYVHDHRLPGMLHGRVLRPPYAGVDAGDFVGRSLLAVHEASILHIPGIQKIVVIGDFIGIVADREEQAEAAMLALQVDWAPFTPVAKLDDLAQAISAHPSTPRVVAQHGDLLAARLEASITLDRSYVWPYQMHASIGPSCAVATWRVGGETDGVADRVADGETGGLGARATVWAGTQNPHVLRADLAKLTGLADTDIEVIRLEAAGCYGRNSADDVAADALLLARAVGRPVRVQLTRAQEHAWEPKGAAQLMQIQGGLRDDGAPAGYDFQTSYPSNGAPTLALLLTGAVPAVGLAFEMGDRTAVPPYAYLHQRITVNDMAPILRASWLRGVSALPNSFAHESYIDELATAAGVDPVAYRLRYLDDPRAADLVRATADKAGWVPHTKPQQQQPAQPPHRNRPGLLDGPADQGDWLSGQGFAYARYTHSKFPGFGAAWAAWVADVRVNKLTGEVRVQRVVVGHDAGLMVNPKGVQQQVHGNVLQTTSRALKEQVRIDPTTRTVASREWGSYPILTFLDVPVVDVLLVPRPGEAPLGVGESASVPGTAAIANAIFDATGVRFRAPPFTPEVVRAALGVLPAPAAPGAGLDAAESGAASDANVDEKHGAKPDAKAGTVPAPGPLPEAADPQRPRRAAWAVAGAVVGGLISLGAAALGWRPAIAPVQLGGGAGASLYAPDLINRGRQLAALGNCATCHTAEGGRPLAGGLAMATPFGTVYSTNLTPDAATGIGLWSFSAFQRAMREGVSRDGHHLYPAFPYTAFTQTTDADLTALYAYLMAQPAVAHAVPETRLAWPYNVRPLMALWNALYLQAGPVPAPPLPRAQLMEPQRSLDAARRSPAWQRGAYLVNGLGHCSACHTPRDARGGELAQSAYLGGAMVKGWEAPPLGALNRSPVAWTEDAMTTYLRRGHHPEHGIAGGPMAPVVQGLAHLPEVDVRAMAHYLVSLQAAPAPGLSGLSAPPATPATPPASPAPAWPGAAPLSAAALALVTQASVRAAALPGATQRLFESACGACHHDGAGPEVQGLNQPLALNANLHGTRPDNLIRTVLDGIWQPAFVEIGHMPAFRHALDDHQIAELVAYLRQRFAPTQPPWADLPGAVARARTLPP